jgi:hypothetical protein
MSPGKRLPSGEPGGLTPSSTSLEPCERAAVASQDIGTGILSRTGSSSSAAASLTVGVSRCCAIDWPAPVDACPLREEFAEALVGDLFCDRPPGTLDFSLRKVRMAKCGLVVLKRNKRAVGVYPEE